MAKKSPKEDKELGELQNSVPNDDFIEGNVCSNPNLIVLLKALSHYLL